MSGVAARHYDGRTSAARAIQVDLRRDATGAVLLVLEGDGTPAEYLARASQP